MFCCELCMWSTVRLPICALYAVIVYTGNYTWHGINVYIASDPSSSLSTCKAYITHHRDGSLTRYVKLRVVHAPGMQRAISPPSTSNETISDPGKHHRTCRGARRDRPTRWRRKHSRRMRNPQVYVSGKRPMVTNFVCMQCYSSPSKSKSKSKKTLFKVGQSEKIWH